MNRPPIPPLQLVSNAILQERIDALRLRKGGGGLSKAEDDMLSLLGELADWRCHAAIEPTACDLVGDRLQAMRDDLTLLANALAGGKEYANGSHALAIADQLLSLDGDIAERAVWPPRADPDGDGLAWATS